MSLKNMQMNKKPYIEILEQPASKEYRFRYECERRSHGSLPGVHSSLLKKTYPKIKIVGLDTDAYVIVSCVTKDDPYKVHPHRLVSKEKNLNHGVLATTVDPENNEIEFKNIGIQCVRKKDIKTSLDERKQARVDPFEQGYDHSNHAASIDLNVVRMCFQVFLCDRVTGKCTKTLAPVVSDPIYDKQTSTYLRISKLSSDVAPVSGETSLVISGHRAIERDVKVRFFEVQDDHVIWEAIRDPFPRHSLEDQTSIKVITPTYALHDVNKPVHLMIQLIKSSTGEAGKAVPFILLPGVYFSHEKLNGPVEPSSKRKRPTFNSSESNILSSDQLPVTRQPESPDTNNLDGMMRRQETQPPRLMPPGHQCNNLCGIMRNQETQPPKLMPPGHQSKQYFYCNRNLNTGGSTVFPPKRPKLSANPTAPVPPNLPPQPPMHPPHLGNVNATSMMFNNPENNCQYHPPLPPTYQPLPPVVPQPVPHMRQYSGFGGTPAGGHDKHQVPLPDQQNRYTQPKPILRSDYVVRVNENEVHPPITFEVNPEEQLKANGNIMDFDLDRYIDSLSGTLSDIKLNGEDNIVVFCDNHKDEHRQVEPILEPIVVKWNHQEMKTINDYDYTTRNILNKNQNWNDLELLTNIEIENEKTGSSGETRNSERNENKGNTEENLLRVCDNTINEILKISKQNCQQNNA